MANAGFSSTVSPGEMGDAYKSMAGRLQQPLLKALEVKGYERMSPVQEKVLKELPNFRSDCLVQAKTGTGKTIAFLLPALQTLLTEKHAPAGQVSILVVSPTRELATQIKNECDILTSQLRPQIECHTAFGGTSKDKHLKAFLNGNPTVTVATPGRLNDYLSDNYVRDKFANLRTLILDEADTMLEAGFLPAINQILQSLPPKTNGWQGMCFSATMPEKIKTVLGRVLKPGYTHITTVNANDVPTIDSVLQYSVVIPSVSDTFNYLYALIERERQQSPNDFKAIIFGTTANGVGMLYDLFKDAFGQQSVYELHSRLNQNARTRTTEEFKKVSSGLMFASDVIGRGMDFQGVGLVIQVGLPSNGEQYVHRVGRTARAGNDGRAVIMLTDREKYFLSINKHLPIQPYPFNLSANTLQAAPAVDQSLRRIDDATKSKAYQAYLGFHKTFTKQLRLDTPGLVALANEYANAMGCPEPPMIDKRVVGKMGLKGAPGLNVGTIEGGPRPNRQPQKKPNGGGGGAGAGAGGQGQRMGGGVGKTPRPNPGPNRFGAKKQKV